MSLTKIDTIAFDADDTLWHNEDGFHHVEQAFAELVRPHTDGPVDVLQRLAHTERANVSVFGYGVKSFTFSMIETANELMKGSVNADQLAKAINQIVAHGRWLLTRPTVVFEDAEEVLSELTHQYRLLLVTKGDSHHQLSKVAESGLSKYFDHIEVVGEKNTATYADLAKMHGFELQQFLMIGNSVKSDVLPVLDAGGCAVHIPYTYTWDLELAEVPPDHPGLPRFHRATSLRDVPELLNRGN
jgi:putative hydrolase of the HAD superfamily